MLNKCQAVRRDVPNGYVHSMSSSFGCSAQQVRLAAESDVTKHVIRKFLIDYDGLGGKIRGYSRQSRPIFLRFHLEVRISQKGRHRPEHHRPGERCHRRGPLGHENDDAIPGADTTLAKHSALLGSPFAELAEGQSLPLILIDPEGDKREIARGRLQRLDEIVE